MWSSARIERSGRSPRTGTEGPLREWVYVNETCLNEELLKAGRAWHYKRYSSERRLADLEIEARGSKGFWSDPHAISPWNLRHGRK